MNEVIIFERGGFMSNKALLVGINKYKIPWADLQKRERD